MTKIKNFFIATAKSILTSLYFILLICILFIHKTRVVLIIGAIALFLYDFKNIAFIIVVIQTIESHIITKYISTQIDKHNARRANNLTRNFEKILSELPKEQQEEEK